MEPADPLLPGDAEPLRHPPLPILAEGEGWIVVGKPPHVVVHRNPNMRDASAVIQRARTQVGRHVFLAHRLDRNTSGCLLIATDKAKAGPLSRAVTADGACKTYLAFVRGYFDHEGVVQVDTPIKTELGYKDARSLVEQLGRCDDPRCSLLRVRPLTGRTHQVRRHVRDLNHPIIKDGDHGDSRVNKWWREEYGVQRMGLHCLRLQLTVEDGERIDVTCPLFQDQQDLYRRLPWWEDALAREPALALPALSMDWVGSGW